MHLVALAEALTTCKMMGFDMNTVYEAIRISSGNSFVHETESPVILNGSRDINFTMDLVIKDVGLSSEPARGRRSRHPLPRPSPASGRGVQEDRSRFGTIKKRPRRVHRRGLFAGPYFGCISQASAGAPGTTGSIATTVPMATPGKSTGKGRVMSPASKFES